MQALITNTFGVDYTEFKKLLHANRGMVAGGAALYALLYSQANEAKFTGDLDIWIQVEDLKTATKNTDPIGERVVTNNSSAIARNLIPLVWEYFLSKYGYSRKTNTFRDGYSEGRMAQIVRNIVTFENTNGYKIQEITTVIPLVDIPATFDISACATWWLPDTDLIQSFDLTNTLNRRAYSLHDNPTVRELNRLEKYRSRGFTIFESKDAANKNNVLTW